MTTTEIATIAFTDQEARDEGVAVVRSSPSSVGLTLSLRQNGDVEVFLSPDEAKSLISALQTALAKCEPDSVSKEANR